MAATTLPKDTASANAATYVYVSSADDGDIGMYRLLDTGELQPGARSPAASVVMPMAVSPDRRFLYAVSRSTPYRVHAYAIARDTGALAPLSATPMCESFAYISLDRTGRFLFGASYGGSLISVNAVESDGRVAVEPLQLIPVGRNAHAVRIDASNRYVYVPTLGSDQIFQFTFDEKTGRLSSNTPAVVLTSAMLGPRHFVTSADNRFVFVLSEMQGSVTTYALDASTGLLTEVASASSLPPDTGLVPGAPRGRSGAPGGPPPRNTDHDVWAADIQTTPDGRFVYISERTSSTLGALAVNDDTGELTYLSTTATERQPRGFAIDPRGRYMVVTGEKSDTISVYAIDPGTGGLRLLDKYPTGKGSNWVEIVGFD